MNRRALIGSALAALGARLWPWRKPREEVAIFEFWEPGMVRPWGWWNLSDFDGEKIPDRSGNGNHWFVSHKSSEFDIISVVVVDRVDQS